ncbi:MAG TPA: hypothetical protein VKB38_19615 [Terracidiphilus sp.]|nr:hypothetical protein [Terracidiphilus sp.]
MGKSAFLPAIIFLLATPFAPAQTRVTVAQMEQQLASLSQQKEDAAASQLARLQLSERVSPSRLAQWQSRFKGQRARQILLYLADASSIYDLPASELPSTPPPDDATRAAILERARQYVRSMRPRLPNFSAVRTSTSYEVTSLDQIEAEERQLQFLELTRDRLGFHSLGTVAHPQQLFLEGSAESLVTYQDGAEVQSDPQTQGKHRTLVPRSLTSEGEFGPILSLVDQDTVNGSIAWSHWEQGDSGPLAVFRYTVPADKSHFAVFSPMASIPGVSSENHPAYHGEIAVDPETGSVLRIAIIADPSPSNPSEGFGNPASMVVEYGPVEIGAKTYICPVHAVAITQVFDPGDSKAPALPRTFVNDVTFTNYHLFRSDMRILP